MSDPPRRPAPGQPGPQSARQPPVGDVRRPLDDPAVGDVRSKYLVVVSGAADENHLDEDEARLRL